MRTRRIRGGRPRPGPSESELGVANTPLPAATTRMDGVGEAGTSLAPFRLHTPAPSVHLIPDFVSEAEEAFLLKKVRHPPLRITITALTP